MFTGLIEDCGTVVSLTHNTITIATTLSDISLIDSIAVNGVCLTVSHLRTGNPLHITMDVMPETFQKTNLHSTYLHGGHTVNLERALALGDRLGGHIVLGHVEGLGTITNIAHSSNARVITIKTAPELLHTIVPKGSVCIDGISLTIIDTTHTTFRVSIIPETWNRTNLHTRTVGAHVNIETDYLLKKNEPTQRDQKKSNSLGYNLLHDEGYL